jgi:transcriptional regulator with XRE-family HTH domain
VIFNKTRNDTEHNLSYNATLYRLSEISMKKDNKETFGQKLSKWRRAKGMNQAELARALDLSPTYVSYLERDINPSAKNGKPRVSVEVADRIATALGVSTSEVRLASGYAPPSSTEAEQEEFAESELATLFYDFKGLPEEEKGEVRVLMHTLRNEILRRKQAGTLRSQK